MGCSILTVTILKTVSPRHINQRTSLSVFYIQTRNLQLKRNVTVGKNSSFHRITESPVDLKKRTPSEASQLLFSF